MKNKALHKIAKRIAKELRALTGNTINVVELAPNIYLVNQSDKQDGENHRKAPGKKRIGSQRYERRDRQIVQAVESGATYKAVGESFGLTKQRIEQIFKKYRGNRKCRNFQIGADYVAWKLRKLGIARNQR